MWATGNVASWLLQFSTGGSQLVLDSSAFPMAPYTVKYIPQQASPWLDTLAIPTYAATFSLATILIRLIARSNLSQQVLSKLRSSKGKIAAEEDVSAPEAISLSHIEQIGGVEIFLYRIARLLACLALFGLSLFSVIVHVKWRSHGSTPMQGSEWLRVGLTGVYAYTSLLAVISVAVKSSLNKVAVRHIVVILVATWLVFAYRDLWPLATYTLKPIDGFGDLVWTEICLLSFAAIVIPLLVPRQYIPFDPKDVSAEPNPEQTASLISLMLYNFLDSIIFLAYRMPHLAYDRLPPIADYDKAKNLVKRSFVHLDPFLKKSRRHIFFGLMFIFRWDYVVLALTLMLRVVTTFASPIGIRELLRYLETGGENAVVRPWVWIAWLFLGPVVGSIAVQWYIFIATRMMVHAQAIITQLVFDHALRIRVKAENSDSGTPAPSTAAPTPDTASIAEQASGSDSTGSEEETTVGNQSVASTSKGKKRESTAITESSLSAKVADKPVDPTSTSGNLVGKINNLVTSDLDNLVEGRDFLFIVLYIPFQVALCVWFLYALLGWSAFCGMASIVFLFPIPGFIASLIQRVQIEKMKKTDARVQTVTETMNVIRMIKLFGWEPKVNDQLADKREEELQYQRQFRFLELANGTVNFLIPCVTMVITYATFTVVMKQELSASIVFSSMAVFDLLRDQLHTIFGMLPTIIQAKVSLDRVNDFLNDTELLDEFAEKDDPDSSRLLLQRPDIDLNVIGFNNTAFTWSNDNDGTVTPGTGRRNFTLRIEDELTFKRGHINLIIGPTGSGKTSLLMALLGEMHYIPSGPDAYFNLPREGGIAYASQESWVQNETIRENILFGAPFDEQRYNKVIYQCALMRDLTLFEAGDNMEVGEKGLTLSGGQKARITLARAVYSSADILLLDDVLAALDVHTAKWIVDKCFKGDLLNGRTVLLVTHNVAMTSPIADYVISLGIDGRVLSQGTLSKALSKDKKLSAEMKEETLELKKHENEVDHVQPDGLVPSKSDGKLVVAEEISEGHIGWPALKLYFASLGGKWFYSFWLVFLGGMIFTPLTETIGTWFLGYWARQYEIRDPQTVEVGYYLFIYVFTLVIGTISYTLAALVFVYGCLRASRSIHKTLVSSVLGTTLRWLDKTPTSRVITRCTQDIQAVDGPIAYYLGFVIELTCAMLIKFFAVAMISPSFMIPGILVAALGGWCGQIYMKAQLSVKREMSNARAPVLGHFGAAIAGLTSIRAYGAQEAFILKSFERIDRFTRAARTFYNLNRWICIRIESLGGLFAASLAAYLVYGGGVTASNTGFALNMAVGFSSMILWWVRLLNQFEVSGNSLERIQQYLEIEQEPKPTPDGVPPAYWPASGTLNVEKLSARYSPDGPKVLQDVSFNVKSGERVGIVGRTGSGKSSLTLSLLRCIFTEGNVLYDGIPTNTLNLDALRSNITIIPQVPELLSGSLRQNLDPFSQHDDAVLNDALRAAGLFSLQSEMDEGRITLDSTISSGGSNLSVGQRQILALARAIVRRSKLLILDEATSAIDYETDAVIQSSLRRELDKDVTLLTVAHRLQTIMDADKIMVLDGGRIVEFGKPVDLLRNRSGTLRALVDESGDRATLYAMAAKAASS